MCHFASINIFAGLFIRENEFSKLELAHVKRNTDTLNFYFNGRGWKIFTGNRGEARNLYIIGTGALNSLFYEDLYCLYSLYCLTPSFSNFVQPRPCHLKIPPLLFFLLSSFFGWMGYHATFDVLFYLMIIWIYKCRALVP